MKIIIIFSAKMTRTQINLDINSSVFSYRYAFALCGTVWREALAMGNVGEIGK